MAEEYKIIYQGGEGEIVEKKSRFIASCIPVKSEEEALGFIESVRKKYWDARHHCYAYVLGERNELMRCSDDGEPQGTAGKPMLDVLLGAGVHDALVIVTRYFGGVLLGTGGLVRAYSGAARAGTESDRVRVSTAVSRNNFCSSRFMVKTPSIYICLSLRGGWGRFFLLLWLVGLGDLPVVEGGEHGEHVGLD